MSHPIDYAPPAPWHRRRRWRRAITALALVAALAAGLRFGPRAGRRARVLYWQHQCMTFMLPADQIVYDDTPAGLNALAGRPGYTQVDGRLGRVPFGPRPHPPGMLAACHEPACYATFASLCNPISGSDSGAVVFLHERISHTGLRRLVAVQTAPTRFLWDRFDELYGRRVSTYAAAGWWPDAVAGRRWFRDVSSGPMVGNPPTLRIYAGQPDPADPARFSVRYEVGGETHIALGRLTDAGDDIDWTEPPGPAVRPSAGPAGGP